MDKYGVKSTYDALRNKLLNYINTVYLGKNDFLREACEDELQKIGVLSQEPFIEANPAYLTMIDGIAKSEIPADVKRIFAGMIQRGLGVFPNPYKHQVDALTEFYNGNDLFVATGTGSGKTECFMWPMVSKMSFVKTSVRCEEKTGWHSPSLPKNRCAISDCQQVGNRRFRTRHHIDRILVLEIYAKGEVTMHCSREPLNEFVTNTRIMRTNN